VNLFELASFGDLKHVKSILFVLLFTGLLVSAFVPLTTPMTSNELAHRATSIKALSYVPHSYISITGDDDLNATAVGEGWAGDGSSGDPFLIQGYEIYNEEALVDIRDTTLHFKIVDCNLTIALSAVRLENVTNGVIENCLFNGPNNGIALFNVTNIDVVGCYITLDPTWGDIGIYMVDAIDCTVSSCIIEGVAGTDAGIYGVTSEGITLYNNTVFEFDNHGIFFGGCFDMDILNNTLYWNEGAGGGGPSCGILIVESTLAYIYGNYIYENSDNGITISGVGNVTIIDNHIEDNWIHGVYVEFSEYCIIQDNYIAGHGDGIIEGPACGISTYFSDNLQITGNEFWWNALNSITLAYSDFAYISNNFMNHSFDHGIWVYISHNATIEENEIYNAYSLSGGGPTCGVLVEWSNDTSLLHNTLGHNSENGVTILNSHDGEITGNTIFDSEYSGIYAVLASGWEITHNVIFDNGAPGIIMDSSTVDNLIYYNDIGWSGEFLVGDFGEGNYWNNSGVGNWYSDYNGTGTYAIIGPASEIDYYPSMSLYCGVTTPYEYEVGTTGNTMTWSSSALNPGGYELLIDGVSQGDVTWDGYAIAADVDGLPVGTYNVTLIVYHISGHWLANQSVLTVVDTEGPTWTVTPLDHILGYNVPLSYQLQASDASGIDSWAVNDTASFAISSSGLLTNATALEPGIYYVEITVTDTESNSVTVTVMITVNEPVPPVQPLDPALMLAVGGIGVGVVIILIVFVVKKKGT